MAVAAVAVDVIGLASHRPAGRTIAGHMCVDLVTGALAAASRTRRSLTGSVVHTGHGARERRVPCQSTHRPS
ncbi:hypothetical protein OG345_39485 [Streptomyces sp. NBC_01220]|uniref:hypothetical protein n=1 Tax=unclassified Streptomyces TaxID=2593676 RepID=UPI0034385ADC|nr:hypothetical protein OG345_39485 [Streptomyces sp. NBC_01220]